MFTNFLVYLAAGAVAVSSLTGCAATNGSQEAISTAVLSSSAYAQFTAEYSDRDCDPSYDEASAVKISLTGSSAKIDGSGASVDGAKVTIKSGGTYVVSGTLSGGSIIIDAPKDEKVQLVLSGADITSADGPAIWEKQCDKLFITLVGDNKLSDSENYTLEDGEDEPNAALYAKHDMTINGSGTLTVNGVYKHGILTKDDLKITGGTITVTSVEDGIRGRDSVLIKDGTVSVTAGGDGIRSNNDGGEEKGRISIDGGSVTVTAENDGIQAESVLQINGGTLNIKTGDESNATVKSDDFGGQRGGMPVGNGGGMPDGMTPPDSTQQGGNAPSQDGMTPPDGAQQGRGGKNDKSDKGDKGGKSDNTDSQSSDTQSSDSKKAIKSSNAIYINGGTITISAEDDAIHAGEAAVVNDGTLTISTGDDAIHADYSCVVNGGSITVTKCYEGLEGKTVSVNGGSVDIVSSDDSINAADPSTSGNAQPGRGSDDVYIEINGGTVNVVSGNDSLDSNGNIFIRGGSITLDGPSMGMDSALDCDGSAYISGGTLAASGAGKESTMFDSSSEQASVMVVFSSQQEAGTTAAIYDSKGNEIASVTPTQQYSGVVFSSPEMKKGETYTVKAGSVTTEVEMTDMSVSISDTGEAITSGMNGGMGGGAPGGGMGGGAPNGGSGGGDRGRGKQQ
jgi:hypothetical protein